MGIRLGANATDFSATLKQLNPGIVIHCAGPFQGQDYGVAKAALTAGAHYIDLSDGRDFVAEFADHVDDSALSAGLLAISGASTLPALSSAVIDSLLEKFSHLDEIQICIAPGQRAPRGTATSAGVLGYAGKSFKWLERRQWVDVHGWQELRRLRFAGLKRKRWAAACDVPDLVLLPQRYPSVGTVQFRAALELGVQHLGLWMVAAMRRVGVPLPIERWAGPLNRVASLLDAFGTDSGAMLISLRSVGHSSAELCLEWHLTADSGHGPEIPCMAAILVARKLARNDFSAHGAYPCVGQLELADFQPEFAKWGIATTIEERLA
jgi:hypothetical protein